MKSVSLSRVDATWPNLQKDKARPVGISVDHIWHTHLEKAVPNVNNISNLTNSTEETTLNLKILG